MRKVIASIASSTRQFFWFSAPLLVCFFILGQLKDLTVKQILLVYVLWAIYPRVKIFILGMKSLNSSPCCNFNDAVANELTRMQFKLNELVNYNNPCFEMPKEMEYHAVTMMDIRSFVEYWQAYLAYPEIAACELLEHRKDREEKYQLYLLTDNLKFENYKIYLSNIDGKIAYSMLAVYETAIHNKITDIDAPKQFNLDSLNKLKRQIISFALRQCHLELSAIIILRKTDGIEHYDPLYNQGNISEQDLINLNSGGPLGYKNISIKVGAILKGYVYDSENFSFLTPDESEIKIVSVEKDPETWERPTHLTIEIQQIYNKYHYENARKKRGDPVIKTIRYANL